MAETRIVFSAVGDSFGRELWITDGGSTKRLSDINAVSGHSLPSARGQIGNSFYFSADDGTGRDLYRLDLGTSGLDPVKFAVLDNKPDLSLHDFTIV